MRYYLFSFCFCFLFLKNFSQPPHPTIQSVEISFQNPDVNPDTLHRAFLQAKISLYKNTDAVAIHFKVLNAETDAVVYQVDYPFSSALVTEQDGKLVFKKENDQVYISSPVLILHSSYKYVITTGNAQNELSEEYTNVQ